MNELTKTAAFGAVAAIALGGAIVFHPSTESTVSDPGEVALTEGFEDPNKAANLRIVKYDEELAELKEFEVTRRSETSGVWSLPSHDGYPADAADQIRDATVGLTDLKSLATASLEKSDWKLYGVEEPSEEQTSAGDVGIGMLVEVKNEANDNVVQIIIGKKVKGSEGQRFVRKVGQDPVYVAKIDPEKLSTKFSDWVEQDLLKLSTFDVENLQLKDYSVQKVLRGNRFAVSINRRHDITLNYNSTDSKWELGDLITYDKENKPFSGSLADAEELDNTKLNDLKNALGDLKIVDVEKKPAGLGKDLTAGADFMADQESFNSLFQKGFFGLTMGQEQRQELLSVNGEVLVGMKDGVEYVLRFGNVARTQAEGDEAGLNRYLFVLARLNEAKIEKPALEELPMVPAGPSGPEKPADQGAEAPAPKPAAECQDEAPAPQDTPAAPPGSVPAGDLDEEKAKVESERERIQKENDKKLEDYQAAVKKARERVNELNARFAPWYYVVSEDVYKKIRLGRGEIIKENEEAKKDGFGVDAFRDLQDKGLKKEDSSSSDGATIPPN
ncbi:MAG: hypothetical protein CMJ75_17930 [Planctomycetaceae bacterium]|nr:hypothetical protein [Planctomycetaceae bacterium]